MDIDLTCGHGAAATELAAFDAALWDAGISNFNLIYLSSVIPPGSVLHRRRPPAPTADQWGDRLYIVIARQWAVTPGQQAWAGIGWVQDQQTGRGLFVEHHASAASDLDDLIEQSLVSMCSYRKGDWGPIERLTHGTVCEDQPVCALVSAIYQSVTWPDRTT